MKEDVRLVGGTVTGFNALWMFNVKFKFSDTKIYYSILQLSDMTHLGIDTP